MNEKTLIKALRKGNEEAVSQLIQQYYPPLYRYVCTKVLNQADAQDILQETFLRFMKQIPTYRVQGKLLGYFYYLKQMNFREISELLTIPQSTLKSRHARALIHLRNLWKEDARDETME